VKIADMSLNLHEWYESGIDHCTSGKYDIRQAVLEERGAGASPVIARQVVCNDMARENARMRQEEEARGEYSR
jgi:hypothetical protein